jgi:serine/threonine-protein kinase
LLLVEEDISREITEALKLSLSPAERRRLQRPATANASAIELYLKGRYFWNKRSQDALQKAADFFDRAIGADPGFALAHTGLADTYALMAAGYTGVQAGGLVDRARDAATRALALDESLAEAHASLAHIKLWFDWEWSAAEREFLAALTLNPGHVQSRQWYAMFLATRGRLDEAMRQLTHARTLDPLSPAVQSSIGRILHFEGRFDAAIPVFEKILREDPSFNTSRMDLAVSLMAKGELDRALVELEIVASRLGRLNSIVTLTAWCHAKAGRLDQARADYAEFERLARAGTLSGDELALLAIMVGDETRAAAFLEDACQRRAPFLTLINVEPVFRPLLEHEGCRPILQRNGLLLENAAENIAS